MSRALFRRNKFYRLLHWLGRDTALLSGTRVIRHNRRQPKFWRLLTDCPLIFCQFHNLFYFLRIQDFYNKKTAPRTVMNIQIKIFSSSFALIVLPFAGKPDCKSGRNLFSLISCCPLRHFLSAVCPLRSQPAFPGTLRFKVKLIPTFAANCEAAHP